MAYQVNTTGAKPGEEDNDVSSISSKPTLKAFLSQEMGQSAVQIHTNLVSNVGITDIDSLIFIFESDLNELCQELGLKFGDKIKFKSAVSKLQHTFKPKQFVTISSKEQPHIDKINIAIKQANDLQTALQKHLNRIDDHIASAESQVNAQIDGVIESLQRRKKTLQQNLNEWKLGQLDAINKEMAKIWEYHNALKSAKRGIDGLLTKPDASRHKKIKEIVDDLLSDNEKYKGYQDNKSLEQYLINHTKMIGVTFQEMKPLESYGELDSNIKNDAFRIQSIVLESAIKTAENENGFQTKLKWEFMSNKEHKSTGFVVKYGVDNNDNNDQKEDQSEDDLKIDWIVLDEPQIEQEEMNKYSFNVGIYFKFDTKYVFQIETSVDEPINMLIVSNIATIVEDHPGAKILTFSNTLRSQDGLILSHDRTSVQRTSSGHKYVLADTEPVFNGRHCWRVQVTNNKYWIAFGVSEKKAFSDADYANLYGCDGSNSYFSNNNGEVTNNGVSTPHFYTASLVDILLDLNACTLCICEVENCNDGKEAKFQKLPKTHGYVPSFNIHNKDTKLQLAKIPVSWYGKRKPIKFK